MESRKELAAEKKRCGSHNCTQSVLCTYCNQTGLDKETIKHAGNCFAAGMAWATEKVPADLSWAQASSMDWP